MQFRIKDIKAHTKNTISLILEKPDNFSFYPGQFLDIGRIFSISSSPSENFIMLTYKKGISSFKKKLEKVKTGDIISSSHPAGTVIIDDSSPAVLMAGGIGIAPHRSMIKYALDQKLNLPITLIYSNSDEDFIFKKELDEWQKLYPKLKIIYHNTSQKGRLDAEKLLKLLPTKNSELIYYLAGSPSMVDDFENILLKLGVDSTSIRTDRFDGY